MRMRLTFGQFRTIVLLSKNNDRELREAKKQNLAFLPFLPNEI